MPGYLCLILHAHLPFVRHPQHEKFLEENWLYEAITETYLPLIQVLEGWARAQLPARLTLSLSPTLCSMLQDELLQARYLKQLDGLLELAERETHRTYWDRQFQSLAWMYFHRLQSLRQTYVRYKHDLVRAFAVFQENGLLEIITTSATHAVLPLLAQNPAALRGQLLVARDYHQTCFRSAPRGLWLPECGYTEEIEPVLKQAGMQWFILDTHGILHGQPRPRYGVYAPVVTRQGLAAFGRDIDSARQVWSKDEGYPGDPRYRDFYRDIGWDLDLDYVNPYLPAPGIRSYTGLKYYAITGPGPEKRVYDRTAALQAVAEHAGHFANARIEQVRRLSAILDQPPLLVCPYDAELFGHWWYEGPEFLDLLVRKAITDQKEFIFVTPSEYLALHPTHQVAGPATSSWGEGGYWNVWLNEATSWIYPHLDIAQQRMTALAQRFPNPNPLQERALQQAARELLLAQASDWPFILKSGTSPAYARGRIQEHLLRFSSLYDQLESSRIDEAKLTEFESSDNLFPGINARYWA